MTQIFLIAIIILASLGKSDRAFAQDGLNCCLHVQSGSMLPTIKIGTSVSYVRYNNPSDIARGDVVVFIVARDSTLTVLRLIGLPGDRLQMRQGQLFLNDKVVQRVRTEDLVLQDNIRAPQWRETLPNGVTYLTLDLVQDGFYDNTPVYSVPPNSYFVLGDNRDNSTDSRVLSMIGYIPLRDIVGRAVRF